MGCNVEIRAPDELGASLIAIELEQRGLEVVREGNGVSTAVADRATGDELAAAVTAIAQNAKVVVDGDPPVAPVATPAGAGGFAVIVAPSTEKREKWDMVARRIELQIERDAGRPPQRSGFNFMLTGFDSREVAEQASTAVERGLNYRLNFEDAKVVVVPAAAAELVLNVENDHRELVKQLGYAADNAFIVQIKLSDPTQRQQLGEQLIPLGLRAATCDLRLVLGFSTAEEAQTAVERLKLPPNAIVQAARATEAVCDLGAKLSRIHDEQFAQRDLRLVYLYWNTMGGI